MDHPVIAVPRIHAGCSSVPRVGRGLACDGYRCVCEATETLSHCPGHAQTVISSLENRVQPSPRWGEIPYCPGPTQPSQAKFQYTIQACNTTECSEESPSLTVTVTPIAGRMAAGPAYYHTDALGSPVVQTDATGQEIAGSRRHYEPYGQLLSDLVPADQGPGYTGHVTDVLTGFSYMQQRYYDLIVGRFLSVDPVVAAATDGSNFNRYLYVNNNPYTNIDPDGRFCVPCGGAIAGAIISGGISIYNGNSAGTVLKDAAIGGAVGALSTIPGGGPSAVALRAGLASAAGDTTSHIIDKGINNVDTIQSLEAGLVGAVVGGLAKGAADNIVPNRNIPGLSSSHPLVREGRAIPQAGSEATAAPARNATELGVSATIGGAVGAAQASGSGPAVPAPPNMNRELK